MIQACVQHSSRVAALMRHSCPAMQAFDPVSGGPRQCIEMESWPRMERMTETFGATVGRALLESFYATASTEGLSVIFNRCVASGIFVPIPSWPLASCREACSMQQTFAGLLLLVVVACLNPAVLVELVWHRTAMVEARIRRLPGYIPARSPDFDDCMSEGGHSTFLWRLGDAFELWEDQGDVVQEDAGDLDPLSTAAAAAPRSPTADASSLRTTTEVRRSSKPPAGCGLSVLPLPKGR